MLAALTLGVAACATARPTTLAERFLVSGHSSSELTLGPASAVQPGALTPPTPRRPLRTSSNLPTLESTSPILKVRLAELAARPSPPAYLAVAAAYRDVGVDDRAFDYLIDGLRTFPRAAVLHEATAAHWRDWGLPERALRHAHLAVRYAPDRPAAHSTLGTVLWALAAHDAAVVAFRRALELAPDAIYTRHNLCVAERQLGRRLKPCAEQRSAPGASHR